ncbi:MAG: DsrE family protein [Acidimicrobiales bacterium]
MTTILIQGTHGRENPEKANLPFIVGNVAATADQDVTIFLTSDAVWLATKGYADDIEFGGHPAVGDMAAAFVENGGTIWACGACTGPRDIDADELIDGVTIVSAANLTEFLVGGAQTIGF